MTPVAPVCGHPSLGTPLSGIPDSDSGHPGVFFGSVIHGHRQGGCQCGCDGRAFNLIEPEGSGLPARCRPGNCPRDSEPRAARANRPTERPGRLLEFSYRPRRNPPPEPGVDSPDPGQIGSSRIPNLPIPAKPGFPISRIPGIFPSVGLGSRPNREEQLEPPSAAGCCSQKREPRWPSPAEPYAPGVRTAVRRGPGRCAQRGPVARTTH